MHPPITYELRVTFDGSPQEAFRTKRRLLDWLLVNGVESFVEGSLDVDINQNQEEAPRDYYSELGGDLTPVSIYRYGKESLLELQVKMGRDFATGTSVVLCEHSTDAWMEGWKEGFKPFATAAFHVRPPWIDEPCPVGLHGLVIEPGMAFGTGQHATTRLCLEALARIAKVQGPPLGGRRALDVGTGTGILAIGAKLLGYGATLGTDIEDDAILAARDNARTNSVEVELRKGSIPEGDGAWDLVFANILAVVLLKIMPDLARVTAPGGSLVLSGLLVEEEDEVLERARTCGLDVVARDRLDGWAALSVVKRV